MLKSVMRNCALGAALIVLFGGCSADSNDAPQNDLLLPESATVTERSETQASETTEPGTMVVPAGTAGAQLGLVRWELGADGIYGLDGNGRALAEFHVVVDDNAIESVLPEKGVMTMDGLAAFPQLTQQFFDAMTLDLQVSSSDSPDVGAGVQPSARECFFFLSSCVARVNQLAQQGLICQCRLFDPTCVFLPIGLNCFND